MGLLNAFTISVYALTAYTGIVLGLAEHGPIPFMTLPMTLIGYYWCEVGHRRHAWTSRGLGEIPAIVLGLLAFAIAVFEFFGNNPEGKLLAGIHLVVFLTCVVLMQKKSNYRYWLLLTLGMMQIAVGSVLTTATWFGLGMILYLVLAIWTLSVFTLYRAEQDFCQTDDSPGNDRATPSRRPKSAQAINAVRFEDGVHWLSMTFVTGVLMTSLAALSVSTLFFALIPRFWVGSALGISEESLPASMRRVTGHSTELRLGDLGPILESNDPVLRLQIFDNQTGRSIDPMRYATILGHPEPLFRGAVMTEYDKGNWNADKRSLTMYPERLYAKPNDPAIRVIVPTVRQEIRLERTSSNVLLCMGRAIAMRDPEGYRCGLTQPTSQIVIRRDWFSDMPGAVDYTTYTELPVNNNVGFSMPLSRHNYIQRCNEPPNELIRLRNLSREIVHKEEEKHGRKLTDLEMAHALESYLRDSGEFEYSLNVTAAKGTGDPVEEFLFVHRSGHCQYFAAALTLMLRSVGIPARLLTGFKGGEGRADGFFYVEKRYAHAWVEGWIGNERWVTFDATPEDGRAESVNAVGAKRGLWSAVTFRLTGIWESNVLDISLDQQENLLYRPVREWLSALWERIQEFSHSPFSALLQFINPRNWMSVTGVISLGMFAGFVLSFRKGLKWRRFGWPWKRNESAQQARQRVEFFERFIQLMKKHGQHRDATQTQEEFVVKVARSLSDRLHDQTFGSRLEPISDLFYRVRFGAEKLSPAQESEINNLLARLEQDLKAVYGHPRPDVRVVQN